MSVILQGSISIRVILALWRPISTTFLLGLLVFFELGRDAAGLNNSAACTHAPATFTFPAMALRLAAEVLDLAPSVGTRGSELDFDPAPGVKVWCWGEILGPAPGDPELLSAFNADSHSARASIEADPDFPKEAWVPVDTDQGPPETCTTEWTVCTGMSEETQVRCV